MRKIRTREELMFAILSRAARGARKAELVREVGVGYKKLNEYLAHLTRLAMIKKKNALYQTTERGRRFLELYRKLRPRPA